MQLFLRPFYIPSALALCLALFTSGCNKQADAPSLAESTDSAAVVAQKVQNPWPDEVRREVYGDPEIWNTPRIQFESKLAGDKFLSVWSMRTDGSDRRLALSTLEAYETGASIGSTIRSPDNRYLAYKIVYPDPVRVGVYDLKEKKVILDYKASGRPVFMWTSNSENLLFLANGYHYNFNVKTQALTERTSIISGQMFILPGDKQILSVRTNTLEIFNWDGTLAKKVPLKFNNPQHYIQTDFVNISPNGKKLVFKFGGVEQKTVGEVDIATGELLTSTPEALFRFRATPIYWGSNGEIGMFNSGSIYIVNTKKQTLSTLKDIEYKAWGIQGTGSASLINAQPITD